jgi:hypothetical protein
MIFGKPATDDDKLLRGLDEDAAMLQLAGYMPPELLSQIREAEAYRSKVKKETFKPDRNGDPTLYAL